MQLIVMPGLLLGMTTSFDGTFAGLMVVNSRFDASELSELYELAAGIGKRSDCVKLAGLSLFDHEPNTTVLKLSSMIETD